MGLYTTVLVGCSLKVHFSPLRSVLKVHEVCIAGGQLGCYVLLDWVVIAALPKFIAVVSVLVAQLWPSSIKEFTFALIW